MKLRAFKATDKCTVMEAALEDLVTFLHFPQEHWRMVTITFPAAISSTSKAGNDPVYRSTRLMQSAHHPD